MLETKQKRIKRHKRIRSRVSGTKELPRLCFFSSNSHIYAQLINDEKGQVLAQANDLKLKGKSGKISRAVEVGKLIAKLGLEKKIEKVVFDRGGFKYHGVVKALAEAAREGGFKF
ncbi:MAG: 50S ribosomal protein L18 [Patescibacteria group bacterium]